LKKLNLSEMLGNEGTRLECAGLAPLCYKISLAKFNRDVQNR
jgi:hypothetical protein